MRLSKEQRDILVGTVLGDAYLQATGKRNARLRLEQGFKQKDYLLWKTKKLASLFQGKAKYLERKHPLTKKIYRYWRHQSQSTPVLGALRLRFYKNGKKIIPENIERYTTPLMLAVWYMDDGYYFRRDKTAYLYLGNVSRSEAEKLSEALDNKFDITSKVLAKKKGFALYFSGIETIKLSNLIKSHVIKSLSYKLPL